MSRMTVSQRENKRRKKSTQERIGDERFTPMPWNFLRSKEMERLSSTGKALLFEFLSQYNNANNGDLQAAFSVLKDRGWKSSSTLRRAIDELLEARIVILTRQGGRGGVCNLYALTFYSIDDCLDKNGFSKINRSPTSKPLGWWRDEFKDRVEPHKKPTTNIDQGK